MAIGYVWESLYGWADPGNGPVTMTDAEAGMQPIAHHVAHPDAKRRFFELLEVTGELDDLTRIRASHATEEDLLRVHDRSHIEHIRAASDQPKGGHAGDNFSQLGKGGYSIGTLTAGGVKELTASVLENEVETGYALVHPPGHHATPSKGMGFCLFGNISVAAAYVKAAYGVEKIAVVDWDVHHGNGTQDIWYRDPSVFTISMHQDRLFPLDSGLTTERGEEEGYGYCLNLPLPAGSGDATYTAAFEQVVIPALRSFDPELIFVASGFDAAAQDPLGRQMVTSRGFQQMTRQILDVAADLEARIVFAQEGGYSPQYLPFCGRAVVRELAGREYLEDRMAANSHFWGNNEVLAHQQAAIDAARSLATD